MKIIKLEQLTVFNQESVELSCAIGFFDGLHLGHQKIINSLTEKTKALITFEQNNNYLSSVELKAQLLKDLGFEYLVILTDNVNIMKASKEEFIAFLKKNNIKVIACGLDFRFGYQRKGNITDLEEFSLNVVDDQKINGQRISSTLIKELLINEDIRIVSKYLGRYYQIEGQVVEGFKLGRTIGFPTINIDYQGYFLPKAGVYQVRCTVDNQCFDGMANLGFNPTVSSTLNKKLEIHLFDFNQEIYGKTVKVEFLNFIREEKKFNTLEALKEAIDNDKKNIIKNLKSS
ncbi:MAG: bifunctional riboflavin kinase/FAD synthetase [Erysipelotrichales bacterium]|nr:bifunctional riboflavin kinase/FAD synthetase [Erysipelotrichales bacterium]